MLCQDLLGTPSSIALPHPLTPPPPPRPILPACPQHATEEAGQLHLRNALALVVPLLPDPDNVTAQMLPEQINGCAAGHFAVHNLHLCWDSRREVTHSTQNNPLHVIQIHSDIAETNKANMGLVWGDERNVAWHAKV